MTGKILYIEDDAEEIILMNYFFKKYVTDADLITFKDGMEFFDFIHQKDDYKNRPILEGFCCILLDINLPYLNGFEILEKIKKSDNKTLRTIPVVMFSSSFRSSDQEKSLQLGAEMYLQKPMGYNEMKKVLEKIFSQVIYNSTNQTVEL